MISRCAQALLLALTGLLMALPGPGVAQQPLKALTAEEKAKQLADLEKQIKDLEAKREALKSQPVAEPAKPAVPEGTIPAEFMKAYSWRNVGPANMGGRVTALAVNPKDPTNYYVATASGGLLKTVNNGITFEFLFDQESTVSIGDVAVSASNPEILWIGTGENNPRNSVSYGDGVYKSTDAGKTWKNMGLKKSFQIGKIIIHPTNPEIVYIGALGRLYGPNEERGLFKTEDGGKTWKKILYVDDKTGVQEMRMDPKDPNTLIVALWERKRDAFDGFFGTPPVPDAYGPVVTHGASSGLYKTTDGGKNWKKLSGEGNKAGLPTVKLGRIGLDYSTKTKGLVVAIIDTEKSGTGSQSTTYMGLVSGDADAGGVRVIEVTADSPAAKGGLKNEDIIIKYDEVKATDSETFVDYFVMKKPGEKIKLTVKREGKEVVLEVTLGTRPTTPQSAASGNPPTAGIRLGRGDGLKIGAVIEDGPAAKAGLKADDEILKIDGKAVANTQDYFAALTGKKEGDKSKFTVKRGMETKDFEITLGAPAAGGTAGGPPRGQTNTRPFGMGLGGQQANVQRRQGPDGFQTGGVFLSKDNGETWTRINSLNPRPMYFSQIRIDPNDDNTIYVLGDVPSPIFRSTNGGSKFDNLATARGVHADAHALWINPADSRHLIIGCDGGFYVTYDKGVKWNHLNGYALGQFYHVCVDNQKPYKIYGGLQDNGSWGGLSDSLRRTGMTNDDWVFINGGDGFVCRVDPTDPDLVYAESQGGNISRRNLRTGEGAGIRPSRQQGDPEQRFNWNTPYILSSHNPSIFYCGSQFVYRSIAKGANLKQISPELTRTKQGSLVAIAESPRNADVLWAGSDDGYLWITRDGGTKWENVTPNLLKAGLPAYRWIATIETSKEKDGRAYIALDGHRSDDDKPYLFVTDDYGATWKSITSNLPEFGSTRCLREDIVNANVLYCGTEFGAFVSINSGASWTKLGSGLPTVACHEFAQPTTASELVVATHGRSVWILDIAAIRQLKPAQVKPDALALLAPSPATRWRLKPSSDSPYSLPDGKFIGQNPTRGAGIDYVLGTAAKDASLKIVDVNGKLVREIRTIPKTAGLHRIVWDFTGVPAQQPAQGSGRVRRPGASVAPAGTYAVVLTVDGKEFKQSLVVENDPSIPAGATVAEDELEEQDEEDEERNPQKTDR